MDERLTAFNAAKELIESIVEKHGLDSVKMAGPAFTQTSTLTSVDQHISHILDVADWLLGNAR